MKRILRAVMEYQSWKLDSYNYLSLRIFYSYVSLRFGLSTGIFLSALKSYGCNADSIRACTRDIVQFFIVVRAIILWTWRV